MMRIRGNKLLEKYIREAFDNQLKAIDMCVDVKLTLPAAILIYCSIDSLGQLYRNNGTTEKKFKEWCVDYLLNISELNCNEDDLWKARNATVHEISVPKDRKNSRYRTIIYSTRPARVEQEMCGNVGDGI